MNDDLLTAEQLAKKLGVKPDTVRKWHRAGLIPASRLTPKVIRYNLDVVVNTLKNRQQSRGSYDAR
jgi:DNA-binding transcriptional MerR regulator